MHYFLLQSRKALSGKTLSVVSENLQKPITLFPANILLYTVNPCYSIEFHEFYDSSDTSCCVYLRVVLMTIFVVYHDAAITITAINQLIEVKS